MIVVRPQGIAADVVFSRLDALHPPRLLRPSGVLLPAAARRPEDFALPPRARSFKACVTMASLAASRAEVASSSKRICSSQGSRFRVS